MSGVESGWSELVRNVSACRSCPVAPGARPLFMRGDPTGASVLFVLEAPNLEDTSDKGHISIDAETDPTGRFFHELFTSELPRQKLAVTNSVLCLPPGRSGDYPVTASHRRSCATHLRAQIGVIAPRVVAPVGREALLSLALIEPHGFTTVKAVSQTAL